MGFITMKENVDPAVVAQKMEQEKQTNGYYMRASELTELLNQKSDGVAISILEKITEVTGTTKINKVECGGVKGNYTFYIDNYVLDVLIRASLVDDIRIGNSLIYKRIANTNDKSIILQEKVYTFSEYDNLVEKLAKGMKVSKAVAAKNFSILTSLDILNLNEIKKIKTSEVGVTKYKGISMNIPIEITLTGETISKVEIVYEPVGVIEVYNKNTESTERQTIKNFIPIYGERTVLPDSLAYQVAQIMGEGVTIRFPVTINSGDDSWLMIKQGSEMYIEVTGDVIRSKGTDRNKFIIKRNTELKELTYVQVGKKVIKGEK